MILRVGIVGTGYAAKKRAEAVVSGVPSSPSGAVRSHLVAISGQPDRAKALAQSHSAEAIDSWQRLVNDARIDLVVVATVNADHGKVVQAALAANCHVVVEYPLAIDVGQALSLAQLATKRQRLLHVEHIELLGGLHQAVQQHLSAIGKPLQAHYTTLAPTSPAPQKWSYRHDLNGFPLVSALSRVSRLVDLFGTVDSVTCQSQFDPSTPPYYKACRCDAKLQFTSGVSAKLVYGKGDRPWSRTRRLEITGTQGQLTFDQDRGQLTTQQANRPISVMPRSGLFLKDTRQVIDHLLTGTPLYRPLDHSLYTLRVADALRQSSATGQPQALSPTQTTPP
ncbi:MAG: Gfo/Idh/MocA family oxidoreductase [Cyanobacteria bacterium P01_D01_bin.14]